MIYHMSLKKKNRFEKKKGTRLKKIKKISVIVALISLRCYNLFLKGFFSLSVPSVTSICDIAIREGKIIKTFEN